MASNMFVHNRINAGFLLEHHYTLFSLDTSIIKQNESSILLIILIIHLSIVFPLYLNRLNKLLHPPKEVEKNNLQKQNQIS